MVSLPLEPLGPLTLPEARKTSSSENNIGEERRSRAERERNTSVVSLESSRNGCYLYTLTIVVATLLSLWGQLETALEELNSKNCTLGTNSGQVISKFSSKALQENMKKSDVKK